MKKDDNEIEKNDKIIDNKDKCKSIMASCSSDISDVIIIDSDSDEEIKCCNKC